VVLVSATSVPTAWCAGVVTVAEVEPVGGLAIRLKRNISVRIDWTMVLSTDRGMVPFCTAVCSGDPKYVLNGCSWSVPSAAPSVPCSAP
jgi:hypothetical protein